MLKDEQPTPTAGTPTLKDDRFFQQIASDIKKRPDFYKEAGEWLDQEFGAVPYREREYKKLREEARHVRRVRGHKTVAGLKSSLAKAAERGDEGQSQELEQFLGYITGERKSTIHAVRSHQERKGDERPVAKLERFLAAGTRYREKPPAFPTLQEAKRVLLMTWLMTDPAADQAHLGLTEFENWLWDTGNDYDESDVRARRHAIEWWRTLAEDRLGWRDLARRSWQVIQAQSPSTTLADEPGGAMPKADSMEQSWTDDAPEYLPLSQARKLIDERLSMPTLSKLCKHDGDMRYMRKKGRGCKVHIGDFFRYFKSRPNDPEYAKIVATFIANEGRGDIRFSWKCGKCGSRVNKTADRCPNRECPGHRPEAFDPKIERVEPPKPRW